jgi:hypothetical protein
VRWLILVIVSAVVGAVLPFPEEGQASEFRVYSMFRSLGLSSEEVPEKDYYINMGTAHGIHEGSTLVVFRKSPTYDLVNEKLYRDLTFPIATVKVIYVESLASIARLEKFLPAEKTPTIVPRAIMVGDTVKLPD